MSRDNGGSGEGTQDVPHSLTEAFPAEFVPEGGYFPTPAENDPQNGSQEEVLEKLLPLMGRMGLPDALARPTDSAAANALFAMTGADTRIEAIIAELPRLADEVLVELGRTAQAMMARCWRLRAACADEMQQRIASRYPAGVGYRDTEGTGVKAQLRILAQEWGLQSEKTLERDARIHRTFGAQAAHTETGPELPREFYSIAVDTGDPHRMIALARDKRAANAHYSTRDFKLDCFLMKGSAGNAQRQQEIENMHWHNVGLSPEAEAALCSLRERYGLSTGEVVTKALLHLQAAKG